jgi:hypothetical protein
MTTGSRLGPALLLLATTAACAATIHAASAKGQSHLAVKAAFSSAQVTRIVVTLSPTNVSQDLTYDPATGAFSGILSVTAGSYSITVDAFIGTTLVGTGTARVDVTAGQVAQVSITILDTSGPPPIPDHSPVITSLVVPVTAAAVGDVFPLSATALDADGDPISYAWTIGPPGCGTIDSASSASATWTAAGGGACTIQVTVTANGKTDSRSSVVMVVASATGGLTIDGTYVPFPTITEFEMLGAGSAAVSIRVDRSSIEATVRTPIPPGASMYVHLFSEAWDSPATFTSSCGGSSNFIGRNSVGKYASFEWTAPTAPAVCVLTGTLTRNGLTDSFPIVVIVASAAPAMRLAASTWLNYINMATMTTPTFSSQGAQRVWVAVVSWYPPFTDPPPTTVGWAGGTPTGRASDWQMVVRSYDETVHWCSEIWWATSTQQLTDVSVVATRSGVTTNNNSTGILAVYEISGARTTWGASAEHHSTMSEVSQNIRTSNVEVPITATATDSLIIGISQYGDFYSPSDANALTTIDYQQNDGGGDGGAAAWHMTTPTAANTAYTLGVSLPSGNTRAFSAAAIEVLAP